jgi:hypothetical protein
LNENEPFFLGRKELTKSSLKCSKKQVELKVVEEGVQLTVVFLFIYLPFINIFRFHSLAWC